jgi:hypothetical protein
LGGKGPIAGPQNYHNGGNGNDKDDKSKNSSNNNHYFPQYDGG